MQRIWYRIKNWFWWNFQATEKQKCEWDFLLYGGSFMKNSKRISPKKIYR